jgi:NAD(P)-dependent dehydrogenase (short-subunit alcohol dehydrogenase family)
MGDRRAVVTGHSRGLGQAIATELARRGFDVLGISRSTDDSTAGRAGTGGGAIAQVGLDLADGTALRAWLERGALAEFVRGAATAVLVNNAGTVEPIGPPGEQGAAAIAAAIELNVTAALVLTDAFVRATAGATDRRVLHVSSGAAHRPIAGWSVYGATKAALDHHARNVDADRVPHLSVCSIAPGVIDTAMQATLRAVPQERFPDRPRFDALARDGALAAPTDIARRLVDHLVGDSFGDSPVADLREL